ncbi:MAG: DCC1-like thiol-disulfide oxidoreductase family protein [Acidobacteriales bacterium]|nr:DCC1-like thiol-disulfide oxidoreductase family protein [Terriglobales bacterium]
MINGWTGGQYSLFRYALGAYLFVHFVMLLPWSAEIFSSAGVLPDASLSPLSRLFPNLLAWLDSPAMVFAAITIAAAASLLFAAGWHDKIAGLVCWYVLACLFGRNPLIANPSLPFVGWMLIAHCFIPASPYGAWSARARTDPDGGWSLPKPIFLAAWIVMALGYSYSGYTKLISPSWVDGSALSHVLQNPLARPGVLNDLLRALPPVIFQIATWAGLALELLFAPLALFRVLRPWIWLAMVGLHLGLLSMLDFADLTIGMLLLHFFTFDPAWMPAEASDRLIVFYDGTCALCHGAVRWSLAEIKAGTVRYAPLQGREFASLAAEHKELQAIDSVVVADEKGYFVASRAVIRLLRAAGGIWAVLAFGLTLIPSRLRDAAYRGIARIRYKVFGRKTELCPLLPAHLRARFIMDSEHREVTAH